MVYKEPKIKTFIGFVSKLFSKITGNKPGIIYLIKYNSKITKAVPKEIYTFYKKEVTTHIDGSLIYLEKKNNNKRCIILYGKDKNDTNFLDFGAYVSRNIDSGNWKLATDLNNKYLYCCTRCFVLTCVELLFLK